MKIISSITKQVYEFDAKGYNNEVKSQCPECSLDRKKKNLKCFSFNKEKSVGYCNHCNASFYEYRPYATKKEYIIPEHKNSTQLTDKALNWFTGRMISQETLNRLGVYSDNEFMPQSNKVQSVICFPYFRYEQLVNIKYRTGDKHFKLYKDAELIFYNINALIRESEVNGEIIITEGEIDCLSFIEAGYYNTISVPNGAGSTSMEYLDTAYEYIEKLSKVFIAVDNDLAGMKLKDELIRRIGSDKCVIVSFRDSKDANEYLIASGGYELGELLKTAIEAPIKDIVNWDSMYDKVYSLYQNGLSKGLTVGMDKTDNAVSWEVGRLAIVTGIPGHGKSEYIDFIITRLNILHGWKAAYYSPENYPCEIHYSKLASKICGKSFNTQYLSHTEFDTVFEYIKNNFFFIYPDEDNTVDNILSKAKILVRKHGVKAVVIDPYNKLEHKRTGSENETEYVSRLLDRLSTFSKQYDCLVVLVAHPTKMRKENGKYERPSLYDISGSANFYNKADYGLSVYRDWSLNTVDVEYIKIKFKHLGDGGIVSHRYNSINGRFIELDSHLDEFDNSSYLEQKSQVIKPNLLFTNTEEVPF